MEYRWRDRNKNLEGVERTGIEAWRGIVIRLMDKFERVEQYCSNGELAIKSEGMEDTFKDIAVYSTLAMILFRKQQDDATQELTETDRGKDAENHEDKFWAKEVKKREEFARKAVMKWRENGAIS